MRKKSIAISLGVIIVLLIALVFWVMPAMNGRLVEHQITTWQHQVKRSDHNVTIQLRAYHRGWFHSTADMRLVTHPPLAIGDELQWGDGRFQTLVFEVKLNIAHGPFAHIAHPIIGHSWSWGAGMANAAITLVQPDPKVFSNFPILQQSTYANVRLKWDGALIISLYHPASTIYQHPDYAGNVTLQGMRGQLWISPHFDQFHSRTHLHQLKMALGESGGIVLGDITHSLDLQLHKDGIWYGESTLSVPTVQLKVRSAQAMQLDNLKFVSANERVADHTLTIRDTLSIGKLSVIGRPVGAFKLDMSVEKLKPKAFVQFRDLYRRVQQQLANLPAHQKLTDKEQVLLISEIQPVVSNFLRGIEIHLNTLQLVTDRGRAALTARLTLPDQLSPKGDKKAFDLVTLMQSAQAQADIVISKPLFNQVLGILQFFPQISSELSEMVGITSESLAHHDNHSSTQLDVLLPPMLRDMQKQHKIKSALLERGWLVAEEEYYAIHLHYHDQKLKINGRDLMKLLPPPPSTAPASHATTR